jgi:tRNA dimethylallyltransferase
MALAERTGGVIVNADSAQLYRNIPILSAAPSPSDHARADHRLYGIRDGSDPCSAAEWAKLAQAAISEAHDQKRLPILVGGTGLYLRTLLDGIAPVPAIDPSIREAVRSADVAENHAALSALDPAAAAVLNSGDKTRIARALEVVRSTGKTLKYWQGRHEGGIADAVGLRALLLLPPRPWLNDRCDRRFAAMVQEGALEEVEALLARKLDPNLPVMRAIGVGELTAQLRGTLTPDEAIAAGQLATRRYAKRQYTWFAHQPPAEWERFEEPLSDQSMEAALALVAAGE